MEQSKKPEKTNATVKVALTEVCGLGLMGPASIDPFAKKGERVFVELRQVPKLFAGDTEIMAIIYREDGMRQAFVENSLQHLLILDPGVDLSAETIRPLEQEIVTPVSKRALWMFEWDVRRMGKVVGQFIATDEEVEAAIGSDLDFGEILGKHSEITGTLDRGDLRRVTDDEEFIKKCEDFKLLVGYNPLKYIRKEEEE